MVFTNLHRRLLRDLLEVGSDFPLVITGGYAVQAHGLVDRAKLASGAGRPRLS
jgi:hypothetical protein